MSEDFWRNIDGRLRSKLHVGDSVFEIVPPEPGRKPVWIRDRLSVTVVVRSPEDAERIVSLWPTRGRKPAILDIRWTHIRYGAAMISKVGALIPTHDGTYTSDVTFIAYALMPMVVPPAVKVMT